MVQFPLIPYIEKSRFLIGYFDGEKVVLEEHVNGTMVQFPLIPYIEKSRFLIGYFDGEKVVLEEHVNGTIVNKTVSTPTTFTPGSTLKMVHHGDIAILAIEPPKPDQ